MLALLLITRILLVKSPQLSAIQVLLIFAINLYVNAMALGDRHSAEINVAQVFVAALGPTLVGRTRNGTLQASL